MSKRIPFIEISPENSSVKKWINQIRESYPERKDDDVENLIDTFRSKLYTRSKHNFIVGVLLLPHIMMLVHCRIDPSLAQIKDRIYPVDLILHPKNVLRVAIIKSENGETTFSAFEYSRKWSKGHAEFWGIEPEDVNWESLGSIILNIELESFSYPLQLPIEAYQLEEMIKERKITPTGHISVGREEGKITAVEMFRKSFEYSEFYDFYINEKEKLEEHRKMFKRIISPDDPRAYETDLPRTYRYEEDESRVYEIMAEERKLIHNKTHPRFTICFFTELYPRIRPNQRLLNKLYQGIFENKSIEIWHAGGQTSQEPITMGNLSIYNQIEVNQSVYVFSDQLLNFIQDSRSRKEKYILQYYFSEFWKKNANSRFIQDMFDFINNFIILRELDFEFGREGILSKEDHLEFKSASEVDPKPSKFVEHTLIPTIGEYAENGKLERLCILYGIEDNGQVVPLYHLHSDQITLIEEITNEELSKKPFNPDVRIKLYPIPFREGVILSVFMIQID